MIWNILFTILPYISFLLFILGLVYAFKTPYNITSRSTSFFGITTSFWGSVLWHYGIIFVLIGHILGVIIPGFIMNLTSNINWLYIIESSAFGLGFTALIGLSILLYRRLFNVYVKTNTNFFDYAIVILLLFQIITGLYISVEYRWGINWYASSISSYFWSVIVFSPKSEIMSDFQLLIKLHAVNMFILISILPYTKLIHIVTAPIKYLFRKANIVEH